jgi:hypothetical protein
MIEKSWARALCALAVFGLIAAACGDDDTDDATTTTVAEAPATTAAPDPEPTAEPETTEPPADAAEEGTAEEETAQEEAAEEEMAEEEMAEEDMAEDTMSLAGVCPDPLVIQTDWFPESEHGALYQLVGSDYTIDADTQRTSGSLMVGDIDTGIDIEIRAGGPAIGFASGSTHIYVDDSITLAYVSTDQAILLNEDTPTIAVVAPLEKNPQIIQWDPETHPDIKTIADIGDAGLTVNVFGGGTFIDVFVNEGVLSADQIDPSYDGAPSRFITEGGAIAQQGFASESPYSYEVIYEQWAKPIAFELIHDAGLRLYSQTLSIRAGDLDSLRPCLERFVPIVQQAVVDFANDSARANAIIVDAVETINSFWVYPTELAEFSVQAQKDHGLVGNGPDDTVGNMDESRIAEVIAKIIAAGFDVDPSMQPSDIITNEFIDESIGF